MKQVMLALDGRVEVMDVPLPGRLHGGVLVRNAYSTISAGTEGAALSHHGGWRGLYEKARQSPEKLQQVWALTQQQGPMRTLEAVRQRLEDWTPIGYSSAGEIVEIAGEVAGLRPGMAVACMGTGFAVHAEYVAVPRNLVAPLPPGVEPRAASFGALAAIALQGIRRLEATPGERIGVIGLGLIGQLTVRLLVAMGYDACGVDLAPERAAQAAAVPGVVAWALGERDAADAIASRTSGFGLDGVIVAAAGRGDAAVDLACDLCRPRGRVVVVGDVGLGLKRVKMYKKELEFRLACSYGPGRYDPAYELDGIDYPAAFVRWTEQRNLAYFLELLGSGKLTVDDLVSDVFPITQAEDAYRVVKSGRPATFGVLFRYPVSGPTVPEPRLFELRQVRHGVAPKVVSGERVRLGIIGAGAYAKNVHGPNLKRLGDVFAVQAVASRTGSSAAVLARRLGAASSSSDHRLLLEAPDVDAVLIATRHSSHARLVLEALDAGKHVFVEKPMTTTNADAAAIERRAAETGLVLRVGFNRRFSPHIRVLRDTIGNTGERFFLCRINVGQVGDHWSNTREEGGRLLGEGCHFFDLCNWFAAEEPDSLTAAFLGDPDPLNPNLAVTLGYPGGSVAQLSYLAVGHPGLGKELFEAFGQRRAARVDDFNGFIASGSPRKWRRLAAGEKGQLACLREFGLAVLGREGDGDGAGPRAGLLATKLALDAVATATATPAPTQPTLVRV